MYKKCTKNVQKMYKKCTKMYKKCTVKICSGDRIDAKRSEAFWKGLKEQTELVWFLAGTSLFGRKFLPKESCNCSEDVPSN